MTARPRKISRREFVNQTTIVTAGLVAGSVWASASNLPTINSKLDATFFVVADLHFHEIGPEHQLPLIRAMNRISADNATIWPTHIDGKPTNFGGVGQPIKDPAGIITVGDICNSGGGHNFLSQGNNIAAFRKRYELESSHEHTRFSTYVGLGNHDLDSNGGWPLKHDYYRNQMWKYVDSRHKDPNAPVPVLNYDPQTYCYSWNFGRLHCVQTHRFAGDTKNNHPSSIQWLAADLKKHASGNRPVAIFQHYAYNSWALQDDWWTKAERDTLRDTLKGYNIAGIFTGHIHSIAKFKWEGFDNFSTNNVEAEITTGNKDGNGSFLVAHITDEYLDIAHCRYKNQKGDFKLIAPFTKKL